MQPDPRQFFRSLRESLTSSWAAVARPEQLPPNWEWTTWLVMAGRGFGKTRTGAEWCLEQIRAGKGRLALVGPTAGDVRDIMVEGESGILACSPSWNRPAYEPSKRRLTWPNGAVATCFSADEPERLRGPQHEAAWGDEVGTWRYAQDAYDNLMFGLRLGKNPRLVLTTTPRRTKLLKDLLAREGKDVAVTRGRTSDNAANLAPSFLSTITGKYEGTRLGRQELDGEMLEDVPGALWQREWIERDRVDTVPELSRIVVAIDPSVTSGDSSDETGIIVAGRGVSGDGYVLADASDRMAPHEWAREAVRLYHRFKADRIVAEVNQGGQMVEETIHAVDPNVPFTAVHASRGKVTRAEPVSAYYEREKGGPKVHHVGAFPQLEDQMCGFTSDFDRSRAGYSPDRVDALVWALTELLIGSTAGMGVLEFYRRESLGVPATPQVDHGWHMPGGGAPTRNVLLIGPPGQSMVMTIDGLTISPDADGTFRLSEEEAKPLLSLVGWRRVQSVEGGLIDG